MRPKVLWIEDGACDDIPQLVAPVEVDGGYDLVVALNVTDALECIERSQFDAIVVDLRLPPGEHPYWVTIYNQQGNDSGLAKLGLECIKSLLRDREALIKLEDVPAWIRPEIFGVLTVDPYGESGIGLILKRLSVDTFLQKTADLSPTALLEMFDQLCARP